MLNAWIFQILHNFYERNNESTKKSVNPSEIDNNGAVYLPRTEWPTSASNFGTLIKDKIQASTYQISKPNKWKCQSKKTFMYLISDTAVNA